MDVELWGIILAPYVALLGLIIWDASKDSSRDAKLVIESLLTALLIVLTIGQLTVAQRQATIMERQTEIAAAQTRILSTDQRPWIRPTLAEIRDIVVDDQSISLGIDFRFKNSGKSPAVKVSVAHARTPQNKDHKSDQQMFCKMAEISMGDASPTIYPNEDAQITRSERLTPVQHLQWTLGGETDRHSTWCLRSTAASLTRPLSTISYTTAASHSPFESATETASG